MFITPTHEAVSIIKFPYPVLYFILYIGRR